MISAQASDARPSGAAFEDGLGARALLSDRTGGEPLEILYLRRELTALPSFEFALRERVARLANFHHAYFGRVRRIDRTEGGGLAVVSEHVAGMRLAEILALAARQGIALDVTAALCLLRQILPAVALLHENARDVAHGALGPERIVVTPHGRPILVEHVLGAALEQLQFPRDRYWRELQVAIPPAAGAARLDQRTDIAQVGATALALLLGRPIRPDEYPQRLALLISQTTEVSASGDHRPLSPALQTWLVHALQIDPRRAFGSARDAHAALEDASLGEDRGYIASPAALDAFLSRCFRGAGARPEPAAIDQAPPPRPADRDRRPAAPVAARSEAAGQVLKLSGPPEIDTGEIEAEEPPRPHRPRRRWRRVAILALVVVALAQGVYLGARALQPAAAPATATVLVESRPSGVPVFIDGVARGATPATLTVEPGAHILELRGEGTPRVFPLSVAAGAEISKYVEVAHTPATGSLEIATDPSGSRVSVDGEVVGVSPISIPALEAGEHLVFVEADGQAISRTIAIEAGRSASLLIPLVPAGVPVSGWLAISAPLAMDVFENGRLLGSSQTERIMVAAGRHELEIANEVVGYRTRRVVEVPAGKVVTVGIDLPAGVLHVNALPWAEVWIDGERVGQTPLGNLEVPVGAHEILFRHPELGERRHAVTVTLREPTRVSLDLRQ